jgi:preprotein translocase subunit SecD
MHLPVNARLSGLLLACAAVAGAMPAAAEPLALAVAQAALAFDQRTSEPIIAFRLTPDATRAFAEFTGQNVGRSVDLRVDGKTVMKAVVGQPIMGGTAQISNHLTVDEARAIAARLADGTARLEVERSGD